MKCYRKFAWPWRYERRAVVVTKIWNLMADDRWSMAAACNWLTMQTSFNLQLVPSSFPTSIADQQVFFDCIFIWLYSDSTASLRRPIMPRSVGLCIRPSVRLSVTASRVLSSCHTPIDAMSPIDYDSSTDSKHSSSEASWHELGCMNYI
jgi:hypothetical protein